MKSISVKILTLTLLFSNSSFAGEPSFEESWEYAKSLAKDTYQILKACGPGIYSAIKNKGLSEDLFSKTSAECQEKTIQYRNAADKKLADIRAAVTPAVDQFLKEQALGIEKLKYSEYPRLPFLPSYEIQILNQNEYSFEVSGKIPTDANFMHIEVIKENAGKNIVASIEKIPVKENQRWLSRFYLRNGSGKYIINAFSQHVLQNGTEIARFLGSRNQVFTVNSDPWKVPSAQVQSDDPEIIALAQEITKKANTDREKAEAIHDWVVKNISYDFDLLSQINTQDKNINSGLPLTALGTLKKKKGICFEYSLLTAALFRSLQVPAKVVFGNAYTGKVWALHGWNLVFIDNRWLIMDTTWDAPNTRKYFDPDPKIFALDHGSEVTQEL